MDKIRSGQDTVNEGHEDADEQMNLSVHKALAGSRCLLVRGGAGSGKTTLLRWIAVRAASKSFDEPLSTWNDKIPFLIPLRSIGSNFPRPEEFLQFATSAISGTMPDLWVH